MSLAFGSISQEYISGMIESPQDKIYTLDPGAISERVISSLKIYTSSGTCTAALKINGVSITGLSAISVTSTPQEVSATALNTIVPGDILTLVISSSVAPVDLVFRTLYTRT